MKSIKYRCKHEWDLLNEEERSYKLICRFYCRRCLEFREKEVITNSTGIREITERKELWGEDER